MPLIRGADHVFEVIVGLPAEFTAGLAAISIDSNRVAGTAGQFVYREIFSRYLFDHLNHLTHRRSLAGSQVIDSAAATFSQAVQGHNMSFGQVGHVDEVADTGAVPGRVLDAHYRESG